MSAAPERLPAEEPGARGNTLLGPGTVFEGLFTFRGSARVDGELRGRVRADGTLVLGPEARVQARIEVAELVLCGHLEGDVIARQRVVLERGARLIGNVTAPRLQMADGAHLEGLCRTGPDRPQTPAQRPGSTENAPESA